jgi:hypothetical protein
MPMIFDRDGNELADIPLSEKNQAVLEHDEEIVIIYHTPQMLRYLLGEKSGTFTLRKRGDHIVAADVVSLRAYAALQLGIRAAQAQERA